MVKMNSNFISEINGEYWDEIITQCFAANVGLVNDFHFYDFVYTYCGA